MGVVTFKLETDEARAVQGFLRLVDAQKKVNTEAAKGGRLGKQFNKGLQTGLNRNISQLKRMAVGFFGVQAAIAVARKIWGTFQEDIKKSVESMKAFQKEFINLQFLGQNFLDPGLKKRIFAASTATGISAPEIAVGMTALKSKTAFLNKLPIAEQRRIRGEMFSEELKLRKTTTSTLPELIDIRGKLASAFPKLTARGQTNIIHQLISDAAVVSAGDIAPSAPRMFLAGKAGGLTARESAGMGAFMTAKTGTAAEAGTAMRRIALKLLLKDPGEQEAIRKLAFGETDPTAGRKNLMSMAGIKKDDNVLTRINKLAVLHKKEPLSAQQFQNLVGMRGATQLRATLDDVSTLNAMVKSFTTGTGPERDIVGDKLEVVRATDPTFNLFEAGEKAAASLAEAQQKPAHLIRKNLADILEARRVAAGGGWMQTVADYWGRGVGVALDTFGYTTAEASVQILAGRLQYQEGLSAKDADVEASRQLGLTVPTPQDAAAQKQTTDALFQGGNDVPAVPNYNRDDSP